MHAVSSGSSHGQSRITQDGATRIKVNNAHIKAEILFLGARKSNIDKIQEHEYDIHLKDVWNTCHNSLIESNGRST